MIQGRIIMIGIHAKTVQIALAPDNLPTIESKTEGNGVGVHFKADKIPTLLQSVDDYLLNARIAEEVCKLAVGMVR